MIEVDVVKAIESVPALKGNVYPLNAKEGCALPFCVYVSSGANEDDALDGWIGSYEASIEINVVHKTYTLMKELARLVVDQLKRMSIATVFIDENQPEIYEPEIHAYRKIINLKLIY